MHIARTLAFTALLLVMGVGYAKTAGGAAVTTMIVMDAAQKKAEAERDGKFAATPVAQCSMCHQEILPFTHLPVIPDTTIMGHNATEPNPEWKGETIASIQWHNTGEAVSWTRIKIYSREKGDVKRIYAHEVPYQPTRFYLPAREGDNPHRILDK